jgi:hypothetical protein
MTPKHLRRVWVVLLFMAAVACPVQAQDIRLNVLKPDELALRRMVVFKKSGDKISSFVKIASFEPASGIFVMEDATGGMVSIPTSEIQKIEFEQTVQSPSPMAQQAHWEIRATAGTGLRYKLSRGALRVESGELVLPASSPSTSVPGPTAPSIEPSSRNPGNSITAFKVVEVRSLTVDGASESFFVEVQNVTYTKETSGSSGLSGTRK